MVEDELNCHCINRPSSCNTACTAYFVDLAKCTETLDNAIAQDPYYP